MRIQKWKSYSHNKRKLTYTKGLQNKARLSGEGNSQEIKISPYYQMVYVQIRIVTTELDT